MMCRLDERGLHLLLAGQPRRCRQRSPPEVKDAACLCLELDRTTGLPYFKNMQMISQDLFLLNQYSLQMPIIFCLLIPLKFTRRC